MKWMINSAASSMDWAYHTIITDNVLLSVRVSPVMFYLLWTGVLVSIVSFFVFVMQGCQLAISVPFMVGSLFHLQGTIADWFWL